MRFKRGGHAGIQGWFRSLKLRRDIRYRDPLQRDLLYFLEFDTAVRWYQEQPFALRTTLDDGRYHEHTPAFHVAVTSQNGESNILVECWYQAQLDAPAKTAALAASAAWAEEHGYDVVVATDQDMATACYLANLKLLWRYSRTSAPPVIAAECRDFLASRPPGTPFWTLRQHLDATCAQALHDGERQHTAPPFIYNLLFRHILFTDLGPPLSEDSLLWLPPAKRQAPLPRLAIPSLASLHAIQATDYLALILPDSHPPVPGRSEQWLA